MYRPACAKVLGVQMPTKVPPPPLVTHRLGYCPSQRRLQVGIGGVRVVVNQLPVVGSIGGGVIRIDGAVAAEEAHVVHHGIRAGHPLGGDGARIDAVGVEADAGDDVGSALGRFEQRLGTADALEGGSAVGEDDAGDAGMQADENCVGLQRDGIRDAILAGGKINSAVLGDGLLERGGIVG